MSTTIIGTIGKDPELRFTQSGMQVMAVNLAVPYGMKDNEGNKPTQWYVATFWGKQAEKLHPYLQKGARISVTLKDLHNEEWSKDGKGGVTLKGDVIHFEFVSKPKDKQGEGADSGKNYANASGGSARPPASRPAPAPAPKNNFDDFDDDIPFN